MKNLMKLKELLDFIGEKNIHEEIYLEHQKTVVNQFNKVFGGNF